MQDNKTLNKDINLIEKECGYWDYEFQLGDYKQTKNNETLRTGLIIACLTSWNYLNRKGNPTYETFGNKSYWELNKKKGRMVEYTIKQYFIEVLNRIRRVNRIINIEITDHPTDPNAYNVQFTVEAINDEIVKANFPLNANTTLSTTYLTIEHDNQTTNPLNPITYKIKLMSEYGVPLENELIHIKHNDNTIGVAGPTNNNGEAIWQQYPFNHIGYDKISFHFNGNTLFNSCENTETTFLNIPLIFQKNSNDQLYIIKNKDYDVKCWTAEVVSNVSEMTDTNQTYLLPNGNNYNKYFYKDGSWQTMENIYTIQNTPQNIQPSDIRLFIENMPGEIYLVDEHMIENDLTLEMFKDHIIIEL